MKIYPISNNICLITSTPTTIDAKPLLSNIYSKSIGGSRKFVYDKITTIIYKPELIDTISRIERERKSTAYRYVLPIILPSLDISSCFVIKNYISLRELRSKLDPYFRVATYDKFELSNFKGKKKKAKTDHIPKRLVSNWGEKFIRNCDSDTPVFILEDNDKQEVYWVPRFLPNGECQGMITELLIAKIKEEIDEVKYVKGDNSANIPFGSTFLIDNILYDVVKGAEVKESGYFTLMGGASFISNSKDLEHQDTQLEIKAFTSYLGLYLSGRGSNGSKYIMLGMDFLKCVDKKQFVSYEKHMKVLADEKKRIEDEARSKKRKEVLDKAKQDEEVAMRLKQRKAKYISKYGYNFGTLVAIEELEVGMNYNMCIDAWGEPIQIQKSVINGAIVEEWFYTGFRILEMLIPYEHSLIFRNGKLVSFPKINKKEAGRRAFMGLLFGL